MVAAADRACSSPCAGSSARDRPARSASRRRAIQPRPVRRRRIRGRARPSAACRRRCRGTACRLGMHRLLSASTMPGTASRPRAAIGEGADAGQHDAVGAATASGSAVTTIGRSCPASRAARSKALRGRVQVARAVIDDRDASSRAPGSGNRPMHALPGDAAPERPAASRRARGPARGARAAPEASGEEAALGVVLGRHRRPRRPPERRGAQGPALQVVGLEPEQHGQQELACAATIAQPSADSARPPRCQGHHDREQREKTSQSRLNSSQSGGTGTPAREPVLDEVRRDPAPAGIACRRPSGR